MPFVERALSQRRAGRLYDSARSLPYLLRPSSPPSRKTTGPAGKLIGFGSGSLHGNASASNDSASSTSAFTGSATNATSTGSITSATSAVTAGSTISSTHSDDNYYFPFDVKTKFVLPVMPLNVAHGFALTTVGQWLENYKGTVRQRHANNILSEHLMKLHTGEGPQGIPCPDSHGLHQRSKVKFNSGSSKYQMAGIGYYFQFCKREGSKAVFHYHLLTDPLETDVIATNAWLSASLEYRKRLAPKKRIQQDPKLSPKKRGKGASPRELTLSPEVLPPPSRTPRPDQLLPPLRRASPVFVLLPPEDRNRDLTPTAVNSPHSANYTPNGYRFPSMNASPPVPPSDVSQSFSCDEVKLISFTGSPSKSSQEVHRRRQANLPSPRTSADVDMPIRFYLPNSIIDTSLRVNRIGRVCLKRDEESLFEAGFPLAHRSSVIWILEPYTEPDPIWWKVRWGEAILVDSALSLTFMIEQDINSSD